MERVMFGLVVFILCANISLSTVDIPPNGLAYRSLDERTYDNNMTHRSQQLEYSRAAHITTDIHVLPRNYHRRRLAKSHSFTSQKNKSGDHLSGEIGAVSGNISATPSILKGETEICANEGLSFPNYVAEGINSTVAPQWLRRTVRSTLSTSIAWMRWFAKLPKATSISEQQKDSAGSSPVLSSTDPEVLIKKDRNETSYAQQWIGKTVWQKSSSSFVSPQATVRHEKGNKKKKMKRQKLAESEDTSPSHQGAKDDSTESRDSEVSALRAARLLQVKTIHSLADQLEATEALVWNLTLQQRQFTASDWERSTAGAQTDAAQARPASSSNETTSTQVAPAPTENFTLSRDYLDLERVVTALDLLSRYFYLPDSVVAWEREGGDSEEEVEGDDTGDDGNWRALATAMGIEPAKLPPVGTVSDFSVWRDLLVKEALRSLHRDANQHLSSDAAPPPPPPSPEITEGKKDDDEALLLMRDSSSSRELRHGDESEQITTQSTVSGPVQEPQELRELLQRSMQENAILRAELSVASTLLCTLRGQPLYPSQDIPRMRTLPGQPPELTEAREGEGASSLASWCASFRRLLKYFTG